MAAALALAIVSCGKRGDPLPPLRPVPAAAEAVELAQIGDELVLRWKAPSRNQDGTAENLELREVRLLRRVIDIDALREAQTSAAAAAAAAQPASETTQPGAETTQPGAETTQPGAETTQPAPAPLSIPPFASEAQLVTTLESLVPGEALVYREPVDPLWMGKRVEYALVYANRRKRESALSSPVAIDPVPGLSAPVSLVAVAGDGFVSLRWDAPAAAGENEAFSIFRRLATDDAYPLSPLTSEIVRAREYEDRTAEFGTEQCWVVAAVQVEEPPLPPSDAESTSDAEEPEEELESLPVPPPPLIPPIATPPRIESAPSREACLTPEDVFAPHPPEDLVGVPSGRGVLLTWRAVDAADLAGYRLYRSTSRESGFELLADVTRASYTDETVEAGTTYYYFVTALDSAPSPNESARSETVQVSRRE